MRFANSHMNWVANQWAKTPSSDFGELVGTGNSEISEWHFFDVALEIEGYLAGKGTCRSIET